MPDRSRRRLSIDSHLYSSARSHRLVSRRLRKPRVQRDPLVRFRLFVDGRVIAESTSVSRMPRIRASSAIFFFRPFIASRVYVHTCVAQPRIFDGRSTGREPIDGASFGGAARAGVGIQDSRRGKSRLVAERGASLPVRP